MTLKSVVAIAFLLFFNALVGAQTEQNRPPKTIAERLGYPPDSKLLILHADDFGMAHSVNRAIIEAFENKWITSASIMVPCPWFPEVARWAKEHPDSDLGVHLTLNSEWANYRWRPLSKSESSSLLDSQGYFPTDPSFVNARATDADVEKESEAQVDAALAAGIKLSHLDTHMQTFLRVSRLFKVYWKLGKRYKLPVVLGKGRTINGVPEKEVIYSDDDVTVDVKSLPLDHVLLMTKNVPQSDWLRNYEGMLSRLPPGTYELLLHLGYNDEELKAMTEGHPNWGAQWRQNDLDVVKNPEFQKFLKDQKFILINWRDLAKALSAQ